MAMVREKTSEVFGVEEAIARGFVEFLEPSGKKLYTISDITPAEVFGLSLMRIYGKLFKSKIVDKFINDFLLLRISRFRLGIKEFILGATGIREVEERKKGAKISSLFAGLK